MYKLDNEFSIKTDANNFELIKEEQFESEDKDGNKKMSIRTDNYYYSNLTQALNRYLQESLRPAESVKNVLDRIKEVESVIKNLKLN